ncbi:dynein axonemal assembly factor 5-like [Portunus trituberculatus]|uniref:dynein axonemal assembly factor 5-like n=1 Tax=Portunus trituberculatus TaxID=210409 RepID=UPI001E1D0411|nr:dynein axonemal assembly factor 5-like [Portunus trituberculatus]
MFIYIDATMATEDAHSALVTELNTILSDLQNTNKAKRRKALERLHHLAFETEAHENQEAQGKILDFSLKHLVTCLADQSEVNRTKSSEILLTFSLKGVVKQGQLVHLIPSLHHRLATLPQVEESEDVRLIQVNIISSLTTQFQGAMVPFMNDVVGVLKEVVLDVSPEVRKAAAECVSCFAKATREKIHMQSESLAKPLVKALHHQRFRNRVAAITALGDLLLYGDGKVIEDVSGSLAQCVMDLPQVRLVLAEVGGRLALHMPDRYSYWHRILPLLLFGLKDEDKDVRCKATQLWEQVGRKYEEENMDQLKQEIDFDVPPSDYPPGEVRPGIGCRSLVQRSLYHILPGLLTDLDDWQASPRLHAAKLLAVLILNADSGVTQYAEKVLTALHLAAGDKEASIVKQVNECGHFLGCFLPPSVFLPLVLPRLGAGYHGERPLVVLAALVEGSSTALLQPCLPDLISALGEEDVALVFGEAHQEALLCVIRTLLNKCDFSENSFKMFYLLLFIASSSSGENATVAQEGLRELSRNCGHEEVQELYQKHTREVLDRLLETVGGWTEGSPSFLLLGGLMKLAGPALGHELEILTKILTACTTKGEDPFVCLHCLTQLRHLLLEESQPLAAGGQLEAWLPVLVSKSMRGHLAWRAGATAETLRTAAVACLEAACRTGLTAQPMMEEVKECTVLLPALIEDDAEMTRLFACSVVQCVATTYTCLIDTKTLHTLADKVLKRLDDVARAVRLKAAHVLSVLFQNLPEGYDVTLNTAYLQDLCKDALIFLDDPDEQLQETVCEWLERMKVVCPDILMKLLESEAHKFRNAHICHTLITTMKTLHLT